MKEQTAVKKSDIDILSGPIGSALLKFALPLAATGILQQLFNAADVAVVGRFVGKNAMAAVGSNSPIIGLIVNLFLGISLGANVVIANLTGRKDREGISRATHTSIITAVISGLVMTTVGELAAEPLLSRLNVPDDVFPMALLYLRIYIAGLPVIFLYNFESAIFRSQGDTRTPLICLFISGIINVILNLFFVLVLDLKVAGVALATIISNLVSSVLLFIKLIRHKGLIKISIKKLKADFHILLRILRIGVPAGIQSCVFSLSNILIQSAINSLGADVMAASAAAFNIEIVSYFFLNSFGQACTTFVGQNYGASNIARCKKVTRTSLLMQTLICIAVSALLIATGKPLLRLFTDDTASGELVRNLGFIRLVYILAPGFINSSIEVLSCALRGYGCSLPPALASLIGVCGTRITWIYTAFRASRTFETLLLAYPISWTVTAAAVTVIYLVYAGKVK